MPFSSGRPLAVEVCRPGEATVRLPLPAGGAVAVGGVELRVAVADQRVGWSVANPGPAPVSLDAVRLVVDLGTTTGPVRFLQHGHQSWSPCGVGVLGVDRDPSTTPGSIDLVRGIYHADPAVAGPGELRSELVTVLRVGDGHPLVVGFEGAAGHDGTFRLRPAGPAGTPELAAEAFLGGAVVGAGERRDLHGVEWEEGASAPALLDTWAARFGEAGRARVAAPYLVGWCSWYHYFTGITEAAFRDNLSRAVEWPFDVFQLDDGYQPAVGDWLRTNDDFPSDLDAIASAVAAAGRTPGIWLAPFVATLDAAPVLADPAHLARDARHDGPNLAMVNPAWGGSVYGLDTTRPETLAHLEHVARTLADAGFGYLKLDFLYAPTLPGRYADPSRTPAQRLRLGLEAIRRGAGDDTFLLGCGCPLGPAVGPVDGMRIGPDVAPSWLPAADQFIPPGYDAVVPSTRNAWRSALVRSFQHRRLWVNDPDCLMLRTTDTALTRDEARAWALAVGMSGGMALVSDDLALLGADAEALLEEVVELGRTVDDAARLGPAPRCDDVLEHAWPRRLSAAGLTLDADPDHPERLRLGRS
ncbi:MAG: alpha-galactosidase [Acidimicrobiales bacterium]|nr:alpha-galactosidase [Acidimicrobiales bacterium]